ncbi:MAG: MFS transporter [Betaproteobacteria bacterium]|nr:MFS transporter [Betaproteobacteria bacterium]
MDRKVWGWAFYYWGNHAFTTSIITVFFPIFFKDFWSAGSDVTVSTFRLGLANSTASLIVALSAPMLGAIADRGGRAKTFLFMSALLGSVMLLGLHWVPKGEWQWAVLFYVLASIGYFWGNVFGDSMLVSVAPTGKLDITSAIGYFAGYLGGGIFLALGVAMTLKPQWFGLAGAAEAVQLLLILAAVWWALFSLPLLFWVPSPPRAAAHVPLAVAAREGMTQFLQTFRHIRGYKPVFVFLAAYWVYIDGVNTVIQMAVDYGKSIGFGTSDLILAVLLVQFVGVPAAIVAGKLGERIGPRRAIFIGLAVYTFVSIYATFMTQAWEFYLIAAMVGLVQGGVQLLSRSYFARLVPKDRAGEFFGFYNMLGEVAAIIGPLLVGTVSYLTGSPRISILSVIVLFAIGAFILRYVNEPRPQPPLP